MNGWFCLLLSIRSFFHFKMNGFNSLQIGRMKWLSSVYDQRILENFVLFEAILIKFYDHKLRISTTLWNGNPL